MYLIKDPHCGNECSRQGKSLKKNIRWLIGEGEFDAFNNCWLQRTYNYPALVQVEDFLWMPAKWNYEWGWWKEVKDKQICLTSNKGTIIWKASTSGVFTLTFALEIIRQRGAKNFLGSCCWNKYIPTKVAVFLWKLLHHAYWSGSAKKRNYYDLQVPMLCLES